MDAIIPWQWLLSAIEPFYPTAARGRCRIPLETRLLHSLILIPEKVPDNKVMDQLLYGEEESVHGDKAHTRKRHNRLASDPEKGPIWCMPFKKPAEGELPEWKRAIDRCLSSLRAIGEFLFRVVKRQFNFRKVRYLGLFKNSQTLTPRFALASLQGPTTTACAHRIQCAHWSMALVEVKNCRKAPFGRFQGRFSSSHSSGFAKNHPVGLSVGKNTIHQRFTKGGCIVISIVPWCFFTDPKDGSVTPKAHSSSLSIFPDQASANVHCHAGSTLKSMRAPCICRKTGRFYLLLTRTMAA